MAVSRIKSLELALARIIDSGRNIDENNVDSELVRILLSHLRAAEKTLRKP